MSTALALTSCEAQTIAAEGGQGLKSASGRGKALETKKGFKQELEDCEAMVISAQPNPTNGSIPNAEAGKQPDPGVVQVIPGIGCVFEGVEVPEHPSDVAQVPGQAVDMPAGMIPADGMPEKNLAQGTQADSTPESNARMQQTEAGGTMRTPVVTQDQILETVGAYIDAAAEGGPERSGTQMRQTVPAQAAAPPTEGQNPTVVKTAAGTAITGEADAMSGMPASESPEASAVQKPAVPAAAETAKNSATDTPISTAAGRSEYAMADRTGSTGQGQSKDNAAALGKNAETGKAGDTATDKFTMADKAGNTVKRELSAKTMEEPVKPDTAAPVTDHRETAPAAKDNPVHAAPQPRAEEAAQYTKENVLRIVDRVSTHASEGRYDFDVELKPEFLGKVNIKLTMEDGVIRMQIKADDMSVRGMLSDQASSLQNALKEKGITLSSVDVTYEGQASLDGGKQPFEQNDGQRRQGGMYYAQAENMGYEPAAEPYSYYVGNSSVEFLA